MFEKSHGRTKEVNRITGKHSFEAVALRKLHKKHVFRFALSGSRLGSNGAVWGPGSIAHCQPSWQCTMPPLYLRMFAPVRFTPYVFQRHQSFLEVSYPIAEDLIVRVMLATYGFNQINIY
jgi:hypothetical protein